MGAVIPLRRETPAPLTRPLRVSIVIRALDRESHIRGSIESAIAAAMRVGGEVIVADCGSSDRTVEIAREYPVTVVQLRNHAERRCGVGSQLGFQRARGEFVYILDADMELDTDFLPAALAAMDADSRLAGIAGVVQEAEANCPRRGHERRAPERRSQVCEWLDMGGLYRAEALRDVGYLSNRNLHALEEMELGLRLCAAGWTLRRIAARGVVHHGRSEVGWEGLKRRWKSRSLDGAGELIRASLGRPYFYRSLQTQRHPLLGLAVWAALLVALALLPFSPLPLLGVLAAVLCLVLARARRRATLALACFEQLTYQISAFALLRGLFAPQRSPTEPIDFVMLVDAQGAAGLHAFARPSPE